MSPGSVASGALSVGVLIPEFPGQTHAFFWRERKAMRALGVDVHLYSTSRPEGKACHAWSEEAVGRTTYLLPLGLGGAVAEGVRIIRRGPVAWGRGAGALIKICAHGPTMAVRAMGAALLGARLARLARRDGVTHVHVHSCANAALIALFAKRFGGPTYSLTLHGPLTDYGGAQELKWSEAAFAVVITRALRTEVREQLPSFPAERIEIAPMGVDKEVYRRGGAYEPWRGEGELRLVSCARLHPRKGHQEASRAVGLLREKGIPARLTILGEGDHRGALESLVDELGLHEAVELPGATDEDRVRAALEASHIFVLASHAEPLGVAIMEGMAMEMPVVTTRAGGVPELVDDGETGMLVTPQRPAEVAAAIEEIASDPERAIAMGRAARRQIEERFHSGVSAEVIARRARALSEGGD